MSLYPATRPAVSPAERRRNRADRAGRYCRINSRSRRRARNRHAFTGNLATSVLFLVALVLLAYLAAGGW